MLCKLMHKQIPVAEITIDNETATIIEVGAVFAPEHVPVVVVVENGEADRGGLSRWWNRRAIPDSRSGLREALEALNIYSIPRLLKECYGLILNTNKNRCINL